MSDNSPDITISLPTWLPVHQDSYTTSLSLNDQMNFVIQASSLNVSNRTGGPFAAGVFEGETGRIVSLGVNLVEKQGMSVLHAEIVALMLAQQHVASYDLRLARNAPYTLVTSAEPCAMCLGAIPWSGINRVVTGVSDAEIRAVGFDEGEKPTDWIAALKSRGIEVITSVCHEEALAVLRHYRDSGGTIYNASETS